MAEITIKATVRENFGKGAARKLRREHLIPAVLYGHGTDPIHLALPQHETTLALRAANALLDIEIPGRDGELALPKDIQRNPVRDSIEHVDLVIVKRGERVHVEVPLVIVGEIKGEAMVVADQNTIMLEAEATNIPAHIVINIDGLAVGDVIYAKDLVLPEGAVFPGDPDDLMLSIQAQQAQDLGETTGGEETEETEEAEAETEE